MPQVRLGLGEASGHHDDYVWIDWSAPVTAIAAVRALTRLVASSLPPNGLEPAGSIRNGFYF